MTENPHDPDPPRPPGKPREEDLDAPNPETAIPDEAEEQPDPDKPEPPD